MLEILHAIVAVGVSPHWNRFLQCCWNRIEISTCNIACNSFRGLTHGAISTLPVTLRVVLHCMPEPLVSNFAEYRQSCITRVIPLVLVLYFYLGGSFTIFATFASVQSIVPERRREINLLNKVFQSKYFMCTFEGEIGSKNEYGLLLCTLVKMFTVNCNYEFCTWLREVTCVNG